MLRFVPGIATNSQAVSDIFTRHMNCPRSKNQHVSKAKIRRFPAHRKPKKKLSRTKKKKGNPIRYLVEISSGSSVNHPLPATFSASKSQEP